MNDINVLQRTQLITVNPTSNAVTVTNAGPQGPAGPGGTLTLEQAVDAVGNGMVGENNIEVTYDDPSGEITVKDKDNPIIHDWDVDGWTPFDEVVLGEPFPGASDFQTLSVVNSRGRVINSDTQDNLRIVYPRDDTQWMDSEITTLCWGGNTFSGATAQPQGGHFHRGYIDGSGLWRCIAINNNIVFSDVNVINAHVWNFDFVENDLMLGSNGSGKTYSINHLRQDARIVGVSRFLFGLSFNKYYISPPTGHGLAIGDPVTIAVTLDSTFNVAAGQAIQDLNYGEIQLQDMEGGAAVTHKFEVGTITPTSASGKLYWPYWIKSRLVGSKLSCKVWRYKDREPSWGDSNAAFTADFAGANNPSPGALYPDQPGHCGLIGNHLRNNNYFEFGPFSCRRL